MLKKDVFFVKELDCQDEIALLKKVLESKKGILNLSFDVISAKMIVEYERNKISPAQIIQYVKGVGLHARLGTKKPDLEKISAWSKSGRMIMVILSGIFIVAGFLTDHFLVKETIREFHQRHYVKIFPYIPFLCYGISMLTGLWFVVPKAFHSIKRVRGDMNLLMFIAVLGALFIGQWFEAASVAFLFSLALVLEHRTIQKARGAIAKLLNLGVKNARVLTGDQEKIVEVDNLKLGDKILIKPGEKIPIDSIITEGDTVVNQAPITGESMPVEKTVGDEIYAGTVNLQKALVCEVSKLSQETLLAKMIYLVEEAHMKKASSEKWIEKFAGIYTPVMILVALTIALVPPLFFHEHWLVWIYRALVVLVIACPCALVISTPVTIVSALTASARNGVLIKGGTYLEIAAKLEAIAFDKTGTLTKGEPTLAQLISTSDLKEDDLLLIAASLEQNSSHPLASAIVSRAKERQISLTKADSFVEHYGKGAEGKINNVKYYIGSHKFLHERKLESLTVHKEAERLEKQGFSIVALTDETKVLALFALADTPRDHIQPVLRKLKRRGIDKLIMLTGDNTTSAETIANNLGIDEFFSELLPEAKVHTIEKLQETYSYVAMVGDGINDAPALATASLGIAMGTIGSDIARETADIALMTDDLSKLPWLIYHARKALKVIKQNVAFSLVVKVIFLTLALFGLSSLWMAIAADTGAALLVVFNALRLLNKNGKV